jgi:hypothetical protein
LHLVGYTWKDIEILGKDSNNAFIKAMTAEWLGESYYPSFEGISFVCLSVT